MLSFSSLSSIKLLLAAGFIAATVPAVFARGGASSGAPGLGVGAPGLGVSGSGRGQAGVQARGPGALAGVGGGRFGRGRLDAGRSYYPSAPFGPFGGGFYDAYPATSLGYGNAPYVDPAPRTVTVIQRGPAFGEPGYISHPVIYRLTPAASRSPGTRRFKVDRLDF